MNYHIDKNIGVSGLKVHWMKSKHGNLFWCRKAIAIMGSFNMPYDEVVKMSPFDPDFRDNYVEGKGSSKKEALANMEKDEKDLADSLWL